jgi:hypothetical protein
VLEPSGDATDGVRVKTRRKNHAADTPGITGSVLDGSGLLRE